MNDTKNLYSKWILGKIIFKIKNYLILIIKEQLMFLYYIFIF